tara:strand:+ start:198 stop:515 length:318 start_codon:yes stop_codon:yes gene_type:complete
MVGVLSISGASVSCDETIATMRRMGIWGDVTPNVTVMEAGVVEPGCRIRITSRPQRAHTEALWHALRREHGLTCAHVHLAQGEEQQGCVLDVFRPSDCPGAAPTP